MSVIVCPACDLVHRIAETPVRRARCLRCRAIVQRPADGTIDTAIALGTSALLLLILSSAYPLVAINFNGARRSATLLDATLGFYRQGQFTLAAIVFATTILGPLCQIAALLYLLVPLRGGRVAPATRTVFRLLSQVRTWTLVEVFMLGTVVALVRVAKVAEVIPGVSLWSYVLLMLTLAALSNYASPEQFWRWADRRMP